MYDDFADEPWHRRMIVRCGKAAARLRPYYARTASALAGLFVCYCIVTYALGYTRVDPAQIQASDHFVADPYNTTLYNWRDGLVDPAVGDHVVQARAALAGWSHFLELVGSEASDAPATFVRCRDFMSLDETVTGPLRRMGWDAQLFLRANSDKPCVCGPQLGYHTRYLALSDKGPSNDALLEALQNDQQLPSIDQQDQVITVVHTYNPVDEHQNEYDRLDGEFFTSQRIDLHVLNEQQDYRYNAARGNYSVIRRGRVRLTVIDRECHRERITLSGKHAFCAQECMDLIRGIDVRQRARIQYDNGVRLNTEYFERIHQQDPGTAPEPKTEL